MPAACSAASVAAMCLAATFSSETMATFAPGRSALMRSPSDASRPRPMTMS